MKKLMVAIPIMILLFSFNVSANYKSKKDINSECQKFGFNFGVAEWENKMWREWTKKEWSPDSDPWGTSVSGKHNLADWDVGTLDDFGLTGIVVKSGKDHYSVNGTSGTITEDKSIGRITFCLKIAPCAPVIQCPPNNILGCIPVS